MKSVLKSISLFVFMAVLSQARAANIPGLYTDKNNSNEFEAVKDQVLNQISIHAGSTWAGLSYISTPSTKDIPYQRTWGPCGAKPNDVLRWAQESQTENGKIILTFTGAVINKTPGVSPSPDTYYDRVVLSTTPSYTRTTDGEFVRDSDELVRDENGRIVVHRESVDRQQLIFELSPDKKSIVKMIYESARSAFAPMNGQLDGPQALLFKEEPPVTCFDETK